LAASILEVSSMPRLDVVVSLDFLLFFDQD
jgi:hypothetical protein